MTVGSTYSTIFTGIFKPLGNLLTLPVGTATVEHSFNQVKMVKTRLYCRLNDENLAQLMQIVIEIVIKVNSCLQMTLIKL